MSRRFGKETSGGKVASSLRFALWPWVPGQLLSHTYQDAL